MATSTLIEQQPALFYTNSATYVFPVASHGSPTGTYSSSLFLPRDVVYILGIFSPTATATSVNLCDSAGNDLLPTALLLRSADTAPSDVSLFGMAIKGGFGVKTSAAYVCVVYRIERMGV